MKSERKECSGHKLCIIPCHSPILFTLDSTPINHLSSLVRQARPELRKPRVRVRGYILVEYRSVVRGDAVTSHVVQRVLLIWASTNGVRNGLDIVANFLVDHEFHVANLGVLDADLVAIVGADLDRC